MRERIQGFLFGVTITLALTLSIPVWASVTQKTIQVSYNNIKLYVDGKLITAKDSVGNTIEPFIYDGTTYLPVRAIGEAFNKSVSWDGNTQSVYVGDMPGAVDYLGQEVKVYEKSPNFHEYPAEGSFKMAGITYVRGIMGTSNGSVGYGLYNLNGSYTRMTGLFGQSDNSMQYSGDTPTVIFYGDGKIIQTISCNPGDMPKNFEVNLTGVLQLKIEFRAAGFYGLGDVQLN